MASDKPAPTTGLVDDVRRLLNELDGTQDLAELEAWNRLTTTLSHRAGLCKQHAEGIRRRLVDARSSSPVPTTLTPEQMLLIANALDNYVMNLACEDPRRLEAHGLSRSLRDLRARAMMPFNVG